MTNVALAVRSIKETHVVACAEAILAVDFRPDTEVVSLVTRYICVSSVRKFAALRSTLRSAPAPDRLLKRPVANSQILTAAAMQDAWQQAAVRL